MQLVILYHLWIHICLVSYIIYNTDSADQCSSDTGSCTGTNGIDHYSSELKECYMQFTVTTAEKLNCSWFIQGISGIAMVIVLNEISISGTCPETTFAIYEGNSDSGKLINSICGDQSITSSDIFGRSGPEEGNAFVKFSSTNAEVGDKFKITFKSNNDVSEPFDVGEKTDVGVILAIILGIVFLGSLFIALTYCSVKTYLRCRYKDPEPSELTSITNLRAERMRERTMKDDFDTPPVMRTSSTERFVRQAYA